MTAPGGSTYRWDDWEASYGSESPTHMVSLRYKGEDVCVGPTAFRFLRVFLNNPGRPLKKDTVLRKVWGAASDNNFDQYASKLNRIFREKSTDKYIKRVGTRTYMFKAAVHRSSGVELDPDSLVEQAQHLLESSRFPYNIRQARIQLGTAAEWYADRTDPRKRAIALALLARAACLERLRGCEFPGEDVEPQCRLALEAAERTNPDLPTVMVSQALLALFLYQSPTRAEVLLGGIKATEGLRADDIYWMGIMHTVLGDERGETLLRLAARKAPEHAAAIQIGELYGYLYRHDYDGWRTCEAADGRFEDNPLEASVEGELFLARDQVKEARDRLEVADEARMEPVVTAALVTAYQRLGETRKAHETIGRLLATAADRPMALAIAHFGIGAVESGRMYLDEAIRRNDRAAFLRVHPLTQEIRGKTW